MRWSGWRVIHIAMCVPFSSRIRLVFTGEIRQRGQNLYGNILPCGIFSSNYIYCYRFKQYNFIVESHTGIHGPGHITYIHVCKCLIWWHCTYALRPKQSAIHTVKWLKHFSSNTKHMNSRAILFHGCIFPSIFLFILFCLFFFFF